MMGINIYSEENNNENSNLVENEYDYFKLYILFIS